MRLLQRRGNDCISGETQAVACVTGVFSPLISSFIRAAKNKRGGNGAGGSRAT
jgi:hypothetical protein